MRRRTFDAIMATGGLILAIVLVAAGALLLWAHNFTNNQVHNQLAEQQIVFPAANNPEIQAPEFAAMKQYAGQQLTTGAQAEVYADHFILNHLKAMPYNGVYSKVSSAARANPKDAALQAEVQTVFQGTTLRGMLLNAYAFGKMGQIAFIAAMVSFGGAFVMLILSLLGYAHLRRTPPDVEVLSGLTRTPVAS